MGYWITRFGSTDLSQIALRQQDALGAALGLVNLPGGGVHDSLGGAQAPVKLPGRISLNSELVEADAASFRASAYALKALIGTRALLYRSPDGGTANSESMPARLENVSMDRSSDNVLVLGTALTFEALAPVWDGAAHTETITLDASLKTAEISNGGNGIVRKVTVTVTASGAPITAITIENLETGHVSRVKYAGTIAVGQSLVIDCGAMTIRNNGVNAYTTAFTLESGHSLREWLRLAPGANTIQVMRTGGDNSSTCVLTYNDGWM